MARLAQRFSVPILAPVLERRATGLAIGAAVALHLGLMHFELPAWTCPVRQALGIPCPGCGLSRAVSCLLRGDWQGALARHAFAPLVLAALVLIIGLAWMPESIRCRCIEVVARLERRTGLVAVLLVALMLYWFVRLLVFRGSFIDSTLG